MIAVSFRCIPMLLVVAGMARCAVPAAERSVRRRNEPSQPNDSTRHPQQLREARVFSLQTPRRHSGGGWWSSWRSLALGCLLLVAVPVLPVVAADPGRTPERTAVHFAFSREMFREVNENDARAAMKVYARTIGEENGLDTTSEPICLEGTNAIAEALRLKQFDMISLTTEEYFTLEAQGLDGPLLVAKVHQTVTEEYVLLARTDSAIRKVEDLPGHTLMLASDLRASLAPIWLEVLCREHGLGPSHKVFATVETAAKVSQVVLPVFFGKADACVVTRNGWEVMGELNPQVKQQLSVLAVSPPVVPGMSCFRRDLAEPIKQRLLQAAAESWDHPSFKQLMALFKTDELSRQPVAVLADTRRLVEAYHQLGAGTTEK